jgi:hypothetical protein
VAPRVTGSSFIGLEVADDSAPRTSLSAIKMVPATPLFRNFDRPLFVNHSRHRNYDRRSRNIAAGRPLRLAHFFKKSWLRRDSLFLDYYRNHEADSKIKPILTEDQRKKLEQLREERKEQGKKEVAGYNRPRTTVSE